MGFSEDEILNAFADLVHAAEFTMLNWDPGFDPVRSLGEEFRQFGHTELTAEDYQDYAMDLLYDFIARLLLQRRSDTMEDIVLTSDDEIEQTVQTLRTP